MFARSLAHNFKLRTNRPVRGIEFSRNRFTNKGSAFSAAERKYLNLDGLLPPAIENLDDQIERYREQLTRLTEPINKYQLLRTVLNSNVTLHYALLERYLKDLLPIVYTPTVGEACLKYGDLYQQDHGLYLGLKDGGRVKELIGNLRKPTIEIIVITDGSRILGLGDLGANGVGISIGKSSLYVAAGGIDPARVLPVVLDVGTDNTGLRNNPMYLGLRERRCNDDQFYGILDEFMEAAKEAWPNAVIQFEDFSNNHCFDMLERYQKKYRCFNDDIQGTGAVVSAGFLNAIKLSGTPAKDHKLLFFGMGSAAVGVADSITDLISVTYDIPKEDVKKQCYFVDSKGLVTNARGDTLAPHKIGWERTDVPASDNAKIQYFNDVVKYVNPTALIGLGATGNVFSRESVEHMCSYCKRPIIFPLSNPSSKAEINPGNAYKWSAGTAIVASGSPFGSTTVNGQVLSPSQGNNLYIFPGVGLGCVIAGPSHIPQEVMVTAALCLSKMVSEEELETGALYPPIETVQKVSREIAVEVIEKLQEMGLAKKGLPTNTPDLRKLVHNYMWNPVYRDEEFYLTHEIDPVK